MMRNSNKCIDTILDHKLTLTPVSAYKAAQSSDLPGGIYDFLQGIADLYGAQPVEAENAVNLLFMMATVFVSGCIYTLDAQNGGGQNADRNV